MDLLGVDVGGTFTDFYYVRDGRVEVHKRPSTPANPALAILEALHDLGWSPDEVVHGSTVATNTVLERRGARVALVTTAGFEDLLEIGRQARPRVYELEPARPAPLVPRDLAFGVKERMDHRGGVLEALEPAAVARVVEAVRQARPDSVAVCLLFGFRNARHERQLVEAFVDAGIEVVSSNQLAPEPREFERASTTVLSAYVGPAMRSYLDELSSGLTEAVCKQLSIVQSSGGTLPAPQAGRLAAHTLLSGPAAGVAGAFALARGLGYTKVLTLDMGGTSTDVCLCDGAVPFISEWSIAGLPVRLPAVDVHTVGAGGGSIARIDEGGALRVGPQSAGAQPGPAAYGLGGPATTTDAHIVLGRLAGSSLLGGAFPVDRSRAEAAMEQLGFDGPQRAAKGVIEVANAVMAQALRVVSVERGHDPADFSLVAFGGAGPLHACELAEALGIPFVLVPPHPGLMSAIGMTEADTTRDYAKALLETHPAGRDMRELTPLLLDSMMALDAGARHDLGGRPEAEFSVDMRYQGQGHELNVPWDTRNTAELLAAFHAVHQQRYGHSDPSRTLELVTLRLRARVRREAVQRPGIEAGSEDPANARRGSRLVDLAQAPEVPLYDRAALRAGNVIPGPAIVEQVDSTTLILAGWQASVDASGTLVLTGVGGRR